MPIFIPGMLLEWRLLRPPSDQLSCFGAPLAAIGVAKALTSKRHGHSQLKHSACGLVGG
jgi:hypothetical protein